jgi:AraC-like DNA-binding protein
MSFLPNVAPMAIYPSVFCIEDGDLITLEATGFFEVCSRLKKESPGPISASSLMAENPSQWMKGDYKVWLYSENCSIGIRDMSITKEFTASTNLTDTLSLEFVLSGGTDMKIGGRDIVSSGMPRAYLSSHSQGSPQTRFHKSGEHIRGVGLWIPPQLLIDRFGLDPELLPDSVQSIIFLEKDSTTTLPITAKIKSILSDIIDMPFTGMLAEEFLNAKITELLCHTVHGLKSPEESLGESNQLPKRKSDLMKKLLQIMDEPSAIPPSLSDLANRLGTSTSTLSKTFKTSYGMSFVEYTLQKKMEKSQQLLQSGKLSVLEVAYAVGYDNQSAFGRAYKRYYNHSPKNDLSKT